MPVRSSLTAKSYPPFFPDPAGPWPQVLFPAGKNSNLPIDKRREYDIITTVQKAKRREKASPARRFLSERGTVKAPRPRRKAATLERSAKSGTAHPRYRMAQDVPFYPGIIRVVPRSKPSPLCRGGAFLFFPHHFNIGGRNTCHTPTTA